MSSCPRALVPLALALWLLAGLHDTVSAQPPEQPPAPVVTASVIEGSFSQPLRLTGNVEAFESTTVSAEMTGVVETILAEEGDYVTSGTPLLRLRQLPLLLDLQVREAEALEELEALRELEAGTRAEDLAVAQASVEEARANEEIARDELDRSEKLFADGSISQAAYDGARSAHVSAVAARKVAEAEYERALEGPRKETIAAQRAIAAARSGDASLARDILERSTFRAPYPGVVTARHVSPGSWVAPGTPLVNIDYIDTVKIRVNVPESYFNRVSLGDFIDVTFDAVPKTTFTGQVIQRIPRADPRTRSFPVFLEVVNTNREIGIGMLARLTIDRSAEGERSVVVPKDALVSSLPKPVVYKVRMENGEAVAESVEVETGRFFGEAVEIFGELRAGEQVVVRGNERLQPGQKLEINTFVTNPEMADTVDPSRFFREDREIPGVGGN